MIICMTGQLNSISGAKSYCGLSSPILIKTILREQAHFSKQTVQPEKNLSWKLNKFGTIVTDICIWETQRWQLLQLLNCKYSVWLKIFKATQKARLARKKAAHSLHYYYYDKSKAASVDGLNQLFRITADEGQCTVIEYRGDVSSASLGEQIHCSVDIDEICDGLYGEQAFEAGDSKTFRHSNKQLRFLDRDRLHILS
jgi:hypothetical protein